MRTDAELLRGYDAEAFAEFYGRHVITVAAYLGRRSRRPEVTFDLVAETFARAYEHRSRYEPRKGPAVAWLLGIARNVAGDAERRGQVSDAARARVGLEPIALDDEALRMVGERSREDLAATLASLPESQRIAVFRRVLAEDEYGDAPPPVSPSPRLTRREPAKRTRDPFAVLGEQLFVAAGGTLPRPRSRVLALVAVAVVLFGAGVAAAALTLGGEDPPPPGQRATPTPTPSPTPTATPAVPADPTPDPFRTPRANPGPGGAPGPAPQSPVPTPVPEFDLTLTPDLTAGHTGWCVGILINAAGIITGGRQCHRSGPPGTNLIAAGGMHGTPGMGYAIVDRSVRQIRLSDNRTFTPSRDPEIPAGWRVATWDVDGQPPTFTLHDVAGQELAPRASAANAPLPARRVDSADPPRSRCAIRAKAGSDLRPRRARLLEQFATLDVVTPSYLSCASTSFKVGSGTVRAAVLLNPRDLSAPAPPLPSTDGLRVRREGPGWLVVSGGNASQRSRVLRALSVTGP
ncbi:hypothetical protein OJ997_15600 [Solirubrobacter phytolaccae]|uniref:RNA polymerase sigma-70 region 2 domain-containing protein n=1 Tax=Solirubrobacter phytolaccae TaxID=1404360 RepID=A0A9X3S840_9ACTN|nr:sigma factor [Solirubrobacter phytolaccae]MDA0181729.1 hypothetical protein [Solirubrobacter phytolaccae]